MVFKSFFACITLFHTKHKSVKQILLLILILPVREGGGGAERLKNLLKVIKMINFHSGSLNHYLLCILFTEFIS